MSYLTPFLPKFSGKFTLKVPNPKYPQIYGLGGSTSLGLLSQIRPFFYVFLIRDTCDLWDMWSDGWRDVTWPDFSFERIQSNVPIRKHTSKLNTWISFFFFFKLWEKLKLPPKCGDTETKVKSCESFKKSLWWQLDAELLDGYHHWHLFQRSEKVKCVKRLKNHFVGDLVQMCLPRHSHLQASLLAHNTGTGAIQYTALHEHLLLATDRNSARTWGAIWLRRNWERIQRRPTKSDRVRSVSWYLLFALTRLWCVQTRQEDLNNVCNQPTNENAGSQLLASHWLVGSHDSSDQLLGNVTTWWHHTQITSSARTTIILTTDIDFQNAFFNLRNCIIQFFNIETMNWR